MNTLLNEDCLVAMRKLIDSGVTVDAVLTDPPYGTTKCKWDAIVPLEPMWECLNRLIKPHGAIGLFANEPFTSLLIGSNLTGFKYRWDWDKKVPSGMCYAKYRPMQQTEDICIFTSSGEKTIYNKQMIKRDKPIVGGGMKDSDTSFANGFKALKKTYTHKNPTTLIQYCKIRRGSVHPTQKPVLLMEYLVKTYTNPGDTVLDFTMGSGTTGVACKHLGRSFVGIELDSKYFEIAKERIDNAEFSG